MSDKTIPKTERVFDDAKNFLPTAISLRTIRLNLLNPFVLRHAAGTSHIIWNPHADEDANGVASIFVARAFYKVSVSQENVYLSRFVSLSCV